MSSRRMDLNQRTFFVLSGLTNELSQYLAVEMCRRFQTGSVALLIDTSEEQLQSTKKELLYLENNIEVICCVIDNWQQADAVLFRQLLDSTLDAYTSDYFQLALILHNEGIGATHKLMEPQNAAEWQFYVQEQLFAVVALNQQFLRSTALRSLDKLIINMTSSLEVKPCVYSSLLCSCKKARDMYFRAMAHGEKDNGVAVISYSAGLFVTHKAEIDVNNNIIDLSDMNIDEKIMKLPRVAPKNSVLKLINILEELSFISGHDVDYYDTFVL